MAWQHHIPSLAAGFGGVKSEARIADGRVLGATNPYKNRPGNGDEHAVLDHDCTPIILMVKQLSGYHPAIS